MNKKHKRFCEEYTVDLNGKQAAIRAGYKPQRAEVTASELLKRKDVKECVSKLQAKLSEKTAITAERVIAEFAKVGFSNIQDFVEDDNSTVDLSKIEKEKAASVSAVKVVTTRHGTGKDITVEKRVEFRLHDKISALEKLGRHLGIFKADNEQSKPMVAPIINVKPKGN